MANHLTVARLRALLHYDPATGTFTRVKNVQGFYAGTKAGSFHQASGYIYVGVDCGNYRAHRLAWFYMTGEWPNEIDHINRGRADNRWVNLRIATRSQNNANMKRRCDNTSGARGVSWDVKNNRWRAYVNVDGKQRHLGRFDTIKQAISAQNVAFKETYGDFASL